MGNRFDWLGRSTTPWWLFYQLIFDVPFGTFLIRYQYFTFCHCEIPRFTSYHCGSTLSLYATYCHCNIHLTFSNTTFYTNINKLQLSIKTITRTGIHTHQHISHISYIHTHIKQKQHQKVMLKVAELDLCCWYYVFRIGVHGG